MEKTILSIDFDIIMYPCINLYNDDVEGNDDPAEIWERLEDEYGLENYNILSYDAKVLLEIGRLIGANKKKPIYFIESHEQIVDILKEQSNYEQSKYHIYNVDFHHDLWYRDTDFTEITHNNEYDCSDWLGYLYLKKKIASMTWLKAPNSTMPEFDTYGGDYKLNLLKIRDFDQLHEIEFDEIYFCLSPQWVPRKYAVFYELIQNIIEGK